ncbi:hypothetical protein ACHQM5_030039 [Ranunculus cassubicifolius]
MPWIHLLDSQIPAQEWILLLKSGLFYLWPKILDFCGMAIYPLTFFADFAKLSWLVFTYLFRRLFLEKEPNTV